MNGKTQTISALALVVAMGLYSAGCETKAQTGALVGGASGAAIGAGIGSLSRSRAGEGALIGAAVGTVGGYIVGNEMDKKDQRERDKAAARSSSAAQPASQRVTSADVMQWSRQGVKDDIIIDRIQRGGSSMRSGDERAMRDAGVGEDVIRAMKDWAQ